MRRLRRIYWALSPVRVWSPPTRGEYLDVQLYVLRWSVRITDPRSGGVFGNGSSWWSGWHNWKREAAEYGPCFDFCGCRLCWNGWKDVRFRTRLRWRIVAIWRGQE